MFKNFSESFPSQQLYNSKVKPTDLHGFAFAFVAACAAAVHALPIE